VPLSISFPAHCGVMLCSCLVAKAYNAGAELVSQEVYEVDPAVTCLTARDYLLYSYYCALIHIGGCPIQLEGHPCAAHPCRRHKYRSRNCGKHARGKLPKQTLLRGE